MKREQMGAIVLAGGRSRRMKGNKALFTVGGQTLIERVIGNVAPVFAEVLISAQSPGVFDFLPYRVIADEQPGQGPIMGILSGLKASAHETNFVIGCDIPDIDWHFLEEMVAFTADHEIVVPLAGQDKYEPLFAFYKKSVIPSIEMLLAHDRRKVIDLFSMCRTKTIPFAGSSWYKNLNTLADYRAYLDEKQVR